MKRVLFAIAAALALSGCAAISAIQSGQSFVVSQNALDAARSSYDAAFLTPAAHYRQLGFCATGTTFTLAKPCADRSVVAKLVAADATVSAEFKTVQGMISAGNNSGLSAAFTTLQDSISTAEALAATLGS